MYEAQLTQKFSVDQCGKTNIDTHWHFLTSHAIPDRVQSYLNQLKLADYMEKCYPLVYDVNNTISRSKPPFLVRIFNNRSQFTNDS